MIVSKLTHNDIPLLEAFCKECDALGWANNNSLKSMKFDRTINDGGGFFGIVSDTRLVSVAGYQYLPEINPNAWRIFFRSATLPNSHTNKGLHRGTGPRGKLYTDAFINELPDKELYLTTNISNPDYNHITRYHRAMKIQSEMRDAYITLVSEMNLYNTPQAIWKLDIGKYLESRKNDNY